MNVVVMVVSCLAIILFIIASFCDLYVNTSTLRKVKKLDDRVTALEEGRVSDDNN